MYTIFYEKVCVYTLRQVISLFKKWSDEADAVCAILIAAVCLDNEELKKKAKNERNAQNGQSNG